MESNAAAESEPRARARRFLSSIEHRIGGLFHVPWIIFERWSSLLFASWALDPAVVRPLVPPQLELQTFDGRAWVSIVPLRLDEQHFRDLPGIPGMTRFAQVNCRTYVSAGSSQGVYFFSLDCSSHGVAWIAARFNTPYYAATIDAVPEGPALRFDSTRTQSDVPPARFVAQYAPAGPTSTPQPGTLEAFLLDRESFFVVMGDGEVRRCDVRHPTWQFSQADATIDVNTLPQAAGIALDGTRPDSVLYAAETQTLVWPPVRNE